MRWVGYARDGAEVIWAVPHGLLRQLAAVAHCGVAAPGKLGDDASNPAFIFAVPCVGYRMEQSGTRDQRRGELRGAHCYGRTDTVFPVQAATDPQYPPCLFRTEWPFCAESRLRRRGRLDERRRGITVHRTRSTLNSAQRLALCAKPQ